MRPDTRFKPIRHPDEQHAYRLNRAHFNWKRRCQVIRERGLRKDEINVSSQSVPKGWTQYTVRYGDELGTLTRFLGRVAAEPRFWALVYRHTAPGPKPTPNSRGVMYENRRQAYLETWLKLLVHEHLTYENLGTSTLTPRTVDAIMRERVQTPTYHALVLCPSDEAGAEFCSGTYNPRAKRRGTPALQPPEPLVKDYFAAVQRMDQGEPASAFDGGIMNRTRRAGWLIEPTFLRSLFDFQEKALRFLSQMTLKDGRKLRARKDRIRKRLLDDLKAPFWQLRFLHELVNVDVFIDWWLMQTPQTRRRAVEEKCRPRFTPGAAKMWLAAVEARAKETSDRAWSKEATAFALIEAAKAVRDTMSFPDARRVLETAYSIPRLPRLLEFRLAYNLAVLARSAGRSSVAGRWIERAKQITGEMRRPETRRLVAEWDREPPPGFLGLHSIDGTTEAAEELLGWV